jgi:hypothetical protein
MIAARRTEGIARMKPSRGGAGTVPRPQDGESAAPKRSGFSTLGKIRVFRRDVPESFEGDPKMNRDRLEWTIAPLLVIP